MGSDLNHILRDKTLVDQIMEHLRSDEGRYAVESLALKPMGVEEAVESLASGKEANIDVRYEAIIKKVGRPALFIQDGKIQEPVLPLWKERLRPASAALEAVLPSVGRIELRGHPRYFWVGTGWHVAPRVIITNRHVAELFARASDGGFTFKLNPRGGAIRASIDFVEEHQRTAEREFSIKQILYIEREEEGRPDVAFLRVAATDQDDGALPPPIPLATEEARPDQVVGAVGYAAWDGNRNEREVMDQIFEGVYEVKRLHPGEIMTVEPAILRHDCSTLGGNSGSAILDFHTGHAVALHYAGRYEMCNFAVKASTVRAKLKEAGIDIERGV